MGSSNGNLGSVQDSGPVEGAARRGVHERLVCTALFSWEKPVYST